MWPTGEMGRAAYGRARWAAHRWSQSQWLQASIQGSGYGYSPLEPVTVASAKEVGACGQARSLPRYASCTGSLPAQSIVSLLDCSARGLNTQVNNEVNLMYDMSQSHIHTHSHLGLRLTGCRCRLCNVAAQGASAA